MKRKRFVIETVHLGVEGGVGERRTEPAPEVGRMLAPVEKEELQPNGGVEGIEIGDEVDRGVEVDMSKGPKEEKKVRGKVRFGGEVEVAPGGGGQHDGEEHRHRDTYQHGTARPGVRHDRMDLYEF